MSLGNWIPYLLGCPRKLVTYSSKLVYKLLAGLTNLLIRDILHLPSIDTKYQQDIPVVADFNPTSKNKTQLNYKSSSLRSEYKN